MDVYHFLLNVSLDVSMADPTPPIHDFVDELDLNCAGRTFPPHKGDDRIK